MLFKTVLNRTLVHRNKFLNLAPVLTQQRKHSEWHNENNNSKTKFCYKNIVGAALFGSVLIGSTISEQLDSKQKAVNISHTKNGVPFEAGAKRPDLPTYRQEEVGKHDDKESFWVTYKCGVYDVTKFLKSHPGGEQILNAGGLSIEPFWNVYGMHKTEEVYKLLESFRIGNLHDDDIVDHSDEEMWVSEPLRSKELIVKTARPFNAETPAKHLIAHFDTPNELFFVRQHMPVPELDASCHSVRVTVTSEDTSKVKVTEFSLEELMGKFPRVTLSAAIMCAGNRRSEMNKVKAVKGINWFGGAISNARWSGVRLRDVLIHCGVDPHDTQGKHVILSGADIDATGTNFSTSIPLHMAMEAGARILLCDSMNGAPLPRDHGYPLRALVPGAPAVRSVKWLESITVSTAESGSHWHQKDYRSFNPSVTWETADFPSAPPVYSLPVTSAFCDPLDGDVVTVRDGHIQLRGYAYSGGGSKILRVDVTSDGGRLWTRADVTAQDAAPHRQHYAWTLWTVTIPVGNDQKEMELWVKATDGNFNTQPEKFDDIWNIRGILSNAYNKITVKLQH